MWQSIAKFVSVATETWDAYTRSDGRAVKAGGSVSISYADTAGKLHTTALDPKLASKAAAIGMGDSVKLSLVFDRWGKPLITDVAKA